MLSYQAPVKKSAKSSFFEGVKAGVPIAIGYMPIALTFGLIARSTGLTLMDTTAMSVFVFAGASQFMALQMLAASTGALEIIIATFIVNIRHFLMSASINERTTEKSPFKKAAMAFGITDETFSVASLKRERIDAGFMGGLIMMAYGSWVVFSALGFVVGASLPDVLQKSMGIALYAMFIGLVVPSLKKYRKALFLFIASAFLCSALSVFIPFGWAIVAATVISSVVVEWGYSKFQRKEGEVHVQ
ncbi:MAG: AzlC family ABC transporter permease [Tuberibacillus sp.]